jgi:hypothetical protein
MLARDHHRGDALGPVVLVADGDLRLSVGAQVGDRVVLPDLGEAGAEIVRQGDRQRHELIGLPAGVAEHQALVARAAGVHAHGDVGRLGVDRVDHAAGVAVEALVRVVVADLGDGPACDFLVVHVGLRRDLTGDHDQPGGEERLAGDAAGRIALEAGVEHRVGDLIGHLVGMAFGDRLGREQELSGHALRTPRRPASGRYDSQAILRVGNGEEDTTPRERNRDWSGLQDGPRYP